MCWRKGSGRLPPFTCGPLRHYALSMFGLFIIALGIETPAATSAVDDKYGLFVAGSSWAITPIHDEPSLQPVKWHRNLSKAALSKLYPDHLSNKVQANLACKVKRSGRLRSRTVEQIQPDLTTTRNLALRVARAHVANPDQINERWGNISAVMLNVRLLNKAARPEPTPCLPPYCRETPAPPVPTADREKP